MDNISRAIEQLKSPNKNERYYACEELRVASVIPQEALDAPQEAKRDSDPDVVDAAQRALAAHLASEAALTRSSTALQDLSNQPLSQTEKTVMSCLGTAAVVFLIIVV